VRVDEGPVPDDAPTRFLRIEDLVAANLVAASAGQDSRP
jgi:hypothetical protein